MPADDPTPAAPWPLWSRRALMAATAVTALGAGLWYRFAAPHDDAYSDDGVQQLWQHDLVTPEGQAQQLRQWRGKPLLVNFWATWCPPCVRELPLLNDFSAQKDAHGIQVVGLALDKPEPVQRFLARQPLRFPIVLAPSGGIALTRALGNQRGALPFSLLLAGNGRLQQRKIGELTSADLAAWSRKT